MKISNPNTPDSGRHLSREARVAMGRAGKENLRAWRERSDQRAKEVDAATDAFRKGLLRDAGANLTATRSGLIEAAVTTFAATLKVRHAVVHSRKADLATLTERVSWLGSNLARLLKILNLDAKPRPRTLADIVPREC
jgi:hypothetical protein